MWSVLAKGLGTALASFAVTVVVKLRHRISLLLRRKKRRDLDEIDAEFVTSDEAYDRMRKQSKR